MSESLHSIKKIREILLSQYSSFNPTDLSDVEPLADQLGLDSLGMIQLCIALEKSFDIELDEDNLAPEYYETVASIAALIDRINRS